MQPFESTDCLQATCRSYQLEMHVLMIVLGIGSCRHTYAYAKPHAGNIMKCSIDHHDIYVLHKIVQCLKLFPLHASLIKLISTILQPCSRVYKSWSGQLVRLTRNIEMTDCQQGTDACNCLSVLACKYSKPYHTLQTYASQSQPLSLFARSQTATTDP